MDVAKFGLPPEVNVITIIIINKEIEELKDHSTKTHGDIATHVLTFMARRVFTNQEFTVAHNPTKALTNDKLYFMVWEIVKALEGLGFKISIQCSIRGQIPSVRTFYPRQPRELLWQAAFKGVLQ